MSAERAATIETPPTTGGLPPTCLALAYHEVTDHPLLSGFQRPYAARYAHSRGAFRAHLQAIAAARRSPVLVSSVDLQRPGRHVLLTFDDGGRSALEAAAALNERRWLGHFFVVTDRIGGGTFMAAHDVRELRAQGHLIGTHSHTHPDIFRDLSRERMLEEWLTSRAILEDLLGERCDCGSVPGGDISRAVLESAAEAGLSHLFTSEPWIAPRRVGACWVLGRACPKAGTPAAAVRALVEGRGWTRARIERRVKELARRGLAPLYRSYVRRVTGADAGGG